MPAPSLPVALTRADWLTPARVRGYRTVLLAVTGLLLAGWIALSTGGLDAAGRPLGTDYLSFWAASRLALEGAPAAAYDLGAHWAVQRAAFGPETAYAAFFYPPPFLLLCCPLGLVAYLPSLLLWLGMTGWAYVAAVRRWLDGRRGALVAALAFPAVLLEIGHGQNAFLTAALLGGGLAIAPRRPGLAGLLLGTLIVKPHLAILLPLALLLRREWRTLAATGVTALAWCAAAWLVLGSGAWKGFLAAAPLARATLEQGLVEPGKMVSSFAALRVLGASLHVAYAAQGVLTLAAITAVVVVALRAADRRAQDAVLVAAALVASPFLLDYDLTLMALPLAALWRDGEANGYRSGQRLALAFAYAAPLVMRPLALGIGVPIAPVVTVGILAYAVAAALRPSPSRR